MKIALLNDTHFGVRNDSMIFDDFLHKFYEEVFFPYLDEHNIKTLIHLGDVVAVSYTHLTLPTTPYV